ncbi:class I SAM-dependent methyltransferase [Streptosporangium sp. NPDC023825]|uniref:class I SAM-dependent methyltransferase n=1 Tax=Streptosporangium sp. NPDC023825 TaxID=3154909 RepID=UPI00342C25EF
MSDSIERYMLRGKENWDTSYVLWERKNLWGDPAVPFTADAVELFAADKALKVLDLPCGDGRNLPPLASAFTAVIGADSSKNALSLARSVTRSQPLHNVILSVADVYATGFVDETFDGIFCCDLLGHLADPVGALRELLRICRDGHCLVANVFATGDSTRGLNMVLVGDEEYIFDERFYFRFYDRERVVRMLDEVAAEVVWLKEVAWMEPPHEGYREYEHEHRSWLFALRKRAT